LLCAPDYAAHVAVLLNGDVQWYEVEPDLSYQSDLLILARAFRESVIRGVPPEVDGTPETLRAIHAIYARHDALMLEPSAAAEALARQEREQAAALALLKAEHDTTKAAIWSLLGEAAGVEGADWRIGARQNKPGGKVDDWRAVAVDAVMSALDVPGPENPDLRETAEELVSRAVTNHTMSTEGSHVLTVRVRNEEDGKWF
jgi:hypothetical protein